jgi:aryl-alcohol dehydrogenase-like predicted oxidoreductase
MTTPPGGTFTMAEDLTVTRIGYGAMQLAGPRVFGPPGDRSAAVAVLRAAIDLALLISIRATIMARTTRMTLSKRRCTHIRAIYASSPKSARDEMHSAVGRRLQQEGSIRHLGVSTVSAQ